MTTQRTGRFALGWVVLCLLIAATATRAQVGVAERLALEGMPNFRDVGGYTTADGRRVKTGLLYRSGHLGDLTDADYIKLARLNISAVCDFRGDEERAATPTKWRGSVVPDLTPLPTGPGGGANAAFFDNLIGASESRVQGLLLGIYQRAVVSSAPSYAATLDRILDAKGAVIYHCSAGKDRTGVFTALLLTFLGVPRETVVEDFLKSNAYTATPTLVQAMATRLKTTDAAAGSLVGVRREYLDGAFATIDKQYGSLDNYRRTVLEFPDADVERLRAKLLR